MNVGREVGCKLLHRRFRRVLLEQVTLGRTDQLRIPGTAFEGLEWTRQSLRGRRAPVDPGRHRNNIMTKTVMVRRRTSGCPLNLLHRLPRLHLRCRLGLSTAVTVWRAHQDKVSGARTRRRRSEFGT